MHRRWLAVVVVGVAGACSSSPSEEAAVTSVGVTAAPTTLAPTTASSVVVPFETEVKRAAIELLELRNEVFQDPDVARVAEYIAPTCVCLERERGFIQRFVDEGLGWTVGPISVVGINLSNPDEAAPTLTLIAVQPMADLVSQDGTVVEHVEQLDDTAYTVSLVGSDGAGWLINGLEGIVLDGPTTEAIIAEGLP